MDYQEFYQKKDSFASESELVEATYHFFNEDSRLSGSKSAQVEFLTTVRYIQRYLSPGDRILDVGAGTGAYSLYFARKGYSVSALELTQRNIEIFRSKLTPQDPIDLQQGNAVDLSRYPDDAFDVVLVFGPLYHLHSMDDRKRCIREALRVCKPTGKLFFAFISNDMVFLTEFMYDPLYFTTGEYDRESFAQEPFPFVFHTVTQCRDLLDACGVKLLHQVASDGISELLAQQIDGLDDENFQRYLDYHNYICEKPEFLGMSNHLLFVGEQA